ncbi:MAG: hypothetical protein IJ189_00635 [Clostridia bacterium]|nr:hypothetical protein [Clostridia bacterium]
MVPLIFVILFLLLITPVKVGVVLCLGGGPVRGEIGVMLWGVRLQGRFELKQGKPALSFRGKPLHLPHRKTNRPSLLPMLKSLLGNGVPSPFRPAISILKAEIIVDVGLQDAATVALLTGLLRSASVWLPVLKIHARPCFGGSSALHARCIAEGRLGMLLAAYLLAKQGRKQKEEQPWIIPSAT